ncbi:hypothetical protein TcCL_NonESM05645 [Trypanosoma cruzi]|uniref:Uncharacterized protein n=1 Tax=Trypanosoma cruzi (strain CL Brener) TaxID=353153 RepID=Q4DAQ6_TRYCC|nr:hypothetical protein, conserved [Trypanosoma cruzi]EAN89605.1 hypothetical protein, conserved [Trypanosoma cruzi]RNC44626.1 hypothetical protein TcCL_NonESM05645 [Trypanosoma cruzi]|eukprot:XP_811456.1 hypothetical protein [Trypanosoma cruzi strain CL Brener]
MPMHVPDPAPCAVESTLWRSCLKEFDYGPDRPKGACEKQRAGYYACIKAWRERQNEVYDYNRFNLVKECAKEAEKLHQCMMVNMFEASRCQETMTQLKRCAARHDPEVRRALADDPTLIMSEEEEEPQGIKRLWYRAIGKL